MAIGRMYNTAGLASAASLFAAAALIGAVQAHNQHKVIPEGETVTKEPLDSITWLHIFIQMFAYGVIFPIGMVLGITKSRWHVPTQAVGSALALVGFFLGHAHGGRQYVGGNVHSVFANILQLLLVAQVVLGLYLKGHWERGINGRIRLLIRPFHSVIGKAMPLLAWVQMVFGGITTLGFCQGDHLGQCAAHFIMGGAFIAYGIVLTIILLAGQLWMRRTGRSQEFFDSSVIAAWGCVNTFTEHRWGSAWVRNDWQHTTMGIVWWCAGLAGIWLSRDRDGNPKRNFIPAFVILITGWAMSAHPQELMVSAMTHAMFGKTLMAVGVTRIIEIAFILKDKQSLDESGRTWNSFQYIPVFLMYASGFLFMGATEEQMILVDAAGLDGVSYTLILYSLAFMVFLFSNMLIHLYDRLSTKEEGGKYSNGHIRLNGNSNEEGRLRDAEEFELEGLSDEEEHDESQRMLNRTARASTDTPSTLGRNNLASAH
ncbi:integral membrane protein (Ytp1), putative [Cordyceps militaris CM01]|uniref:Integral membrane protein (Ytp1), putative n=1 Tax=Cordyceps militaris (strain CM01) TaxID=983644 RepID=G3JNX0_CORMM|nr:integral membrane protein (Ytp1), putative [Cordyceps militaris CM01]EGX89580.1 integral membrane protein (Ytp1), putative [Cordyceps militaris CM01]